MNDHQNPRFISIVPEKLRAQTGCAAAAAAVVVVVVDPAGHRDLSCPGARATARLNSCVQLRYKETQGALFPTGKGRGSANGLRVFT